MSFLKAANCTNFYSLFHSCSMRNACYHTYVLNDLVSRRLIFLHPSVSCKQNTLARQCDSSGRVLHWLMAELKQLFVMSVQFLLWKIQISGATTVNRQFVDCWVHRIVRQDHYVLFKRSMLGWYWQHDRE